MKNNFLKIMLIAFIVTIVCGFCGLIAAMVIFNKCCSCGVHFHQCCYNQNSCCKVYCCDTGNFNHYVFNCLFWSWIILLIVEISCLIVSDFIFKKYKDQKDKNELAVHCLNQLLLNKNIQSISIGGGKNKVIAVRKINDCKEDQNECYVTIESNKNK